jgi:two-component system, chemotaxis family, CheB/CheR fusion protein
MTVLNTALGDKTPITHKGLCIKRHTPAAAGIIKSHKSRRKTQVGDILDVWLTATALADESGQPVEMAITERDLAWLSEK